MSSSLQRQGVRRLVLTRFRSYQHLVLSCTTEPVVLTGVNGAGKTNILEALSFLSPGRGCRSVKLADLQKQGTQQEGYWAVSAHLEGMGHDYKVGTAGVLSPSGRETRRICLNEEEGLSQTRLTEMVNVLWLTPAMDRLFLEGTSSRRKFFDRLVYSFDAQHASRLNRFDMRMRERNRLLADHTIHHPWLAALEKQMSEEAFTIHLARSRVLTHIQEACDQGLAFFPTPDMALQGFLEDHFHTDADTFITAYTSLLETNRYRDQAAGRTAIGPHATDFTVLYKEKNMAAPQCSTGEQKALLVAIILATARLKAKNQGTITLVLLDEIIAHLDEDRRKVLLEEIISLPLQAWMTGTDTRFFKGIRHQVQHFKVENSTLTLKAL